jgi:hypothetical protein
MPNDCLKNGYYILMRIQFIKDIDLCVKIIRRSFGLIVI